MKSCPNCGHPNVPNATFCGECGRSLPAGRPCPGCGFTGNPPQAVYCVQCGVSLRPRSFNPLIWWGGLALVLLVLAGAILWQTGFLQERMDGRPTPLADRPPTPTTTSRPASELTVAVEETVAEIATTPTAPSPTHTPTPSPTLTQSPTATPSPPTNTPTPSSCPGAPPQQVSVGDRARVCTAYDRLAVRAQPRRNSVEITRLEPGTYVTVVDGPACAENWSWWKVQTGSGTVGWVAEGGDDVDPYFICPVR